MSRRSIYDGPEEEAEPWFLPGAEDDDDDAPAPPSDLSAWRDAEGAHARQLAESAQLIGRLEQHVSLLGGADRMALVEASDLLWAEGVRIRPERLWMHLAASGGAPVDARADYALGAWVAARLTGAWPLTDEDGLLRFLGRRRHDQPDAALAEIAGLPSSSESADARAGWLADADLSAPLHPLTRAACLADRWRTAGAGGRARAVEAGVIAARAGAADTTLPFIPLAIGGRRRIRGGAGPAAALTQLLAAASSGAQRALLDLGRLNDWRARVAATSLKKNPAALTRLLATEYAITTAHAARHLGVVHQTALTSLNILRDAGLAREMTGGRSFLFWTADLTAGPGRAAP